MPCPALSLLLTLFFVPGPGDSRPSLSFERRVAVQEAIERVYHRHRTGSMSPFEQTVTREVLATKVRTYLQESAALESVWKLPVTVAMLRRERRRVETATQLPGRLEEIYAALGNDRLLIEECFVRPALTSRLTRAFFEAGPARSESYEDWWARIEMDLPAVDVPARKDVPLALPSPALPAESCRSEDSWTGALRYDVPGPRSFHIAVWTGSQMIVWGGVQREIHSVRSGARYDPANDTWTPTSVIGAPAYGGEGQKGIWTGRELIIWNGFGQGSARYDPAADTWAPLSTDGAPHTHSDAAVWTGSEMIVWGGYACVPVGPNGCNSALTNQGARYDPDLDRWIPMSAAGAPAARFGHSAVWTGTEMIVWGGNDSSDLATGAAYDPRDDSWRPISVAGAPAGRASHAAVWTGTDMMVWGGITHGLSLTSTSGLYNPETDTWRVTAPGPAAPAPNHLSTGHTLIWTGREAIAFRGREGAAYDPRSDSWTPLPAFSLQSNEPHSAVWTGDEMIVFGGGGLNFGGRYDPEGAAWTPTSSGGQPPIGILGSGHSAIWTGTHMIVWGGYDGDGHWSNDGSRYDPLLDSWLRMTEANAPDDRSSPQLVWTGDYMIVWGGHNKGPDDVTNGGRYDPVSDRWLSMSEIGSPECGSTVLVAGRVVSLCGEIEKGQYDPVADLWRPVSGVNQPFRVGGGVSTGTELISWHHATPGGAGGLYDPISDTWSPMSLAGQPPAGSYRGTWTGREMFVWGATTQGNPAGGLYDPETDAWRPVSTMGAPPPPRTLLWTGREVISWGPDSVRSARYDPSRDVWSPLTQEDAPPYPYGSAVWTGDAMILWGAAPVVYAGAVYLPPTGEDLDRDGALTCGGDCNDADAAVHPGAPELPGNSIDENCDGTRACDPGAGWRNPGQYQACVARACRELATGGVMTLRECQALATTRRISTRS